MDGKAGEKGWRHLRKGISAWVYQYSDAVARQVHDFNSRAVPDLRFRYFFPYAGSLSFSERVGEGSLHYRMEVTKAYASSLPSGVLIMPTIDARNDHGEFDGWTD